MTFICHYSDRDPTRLFAAVSIPLTLLSPYGPPKSGQGRSLWTLKSVFARQRVNAEYPDAAISLLLHAYHPASSGMCLKKIAPRVARQLRYGPYLPMEPPVDHQRDDTRQK